MPKVLDLRKKNKIAAKTITRRPPLKEAVSTLKDRAVRVSAILPQRQSPPQISWEAPSFYFNPQKRYLSLLIIALSAGGAAMLIFKKDALTAIFLLLSSLILILYSNKKPEISKITITQAGINIGKEIHYYDELRSFWIHYSPGMDKELSLEPKKWYVPYIKVSIADRNPLIIRSLLINFLPEKEHENSLVDIISKRIGL
ncbi:MAG: hypothetical protein HYT62_04500 [Candidatus Yanofskybacteria bacterium]|nr:hypothetical protein [Candidatus Yanofskybacteria bacterium]